MQRFINDPDFVVDDMLRGFAKAHADKVYISRDNDHVVAIRERDRKRKIGLISGGGSGHEPAFLGYVGRGSLDAVAVGEVFASPPAETFYDAMIAANYNNEVIGLLGNYAGDVMNFKMAADMAKQDGITARYVTAHDDIASAKKGDEQNRHGIAGGYFMWKIGGARANEAATADEIILTVQNVVNKTRSIVVGLSSLTIPSVGKPNFTVEPGKMEFGIGHHGEPGIETADLAEADGVAAKMTQALLDDFEFDRPRHVAVMISGLGAMPMMEAYILYNKVEEVIRNAGHRIDHVYIGNFVTSLNMNGVSLTIVELDDEIERLLTEPDVPVGLENY